MHDAADDWETVQARFADLPGEDGISVRREAYRPFFLRLGADVRIEAGCRFALPDRIIIDDDARINLGGLFYGSGGIRIGRHARIGPRVFVHSANHDVDREDPRAFFERGYDYKAVEIGDNVLISADVRILPGATLGATSFVAAGATVVGKVYAEASYLAGTPASTLAAPVLDNAEIPPSAAEVAIVLRRGLVERRRAWRHLLSVIGLPQIMLVEEGERLPPSVIAVLIDGDDVGTMPGDVDIWRIERGSKFLAANDGNVTLALPGLSDDIELPARRRSRYRPQVDCLSSNAERAQAYTFWLHDRLTKREDPLPLGEFLEWAVSIQVLGIEPGRGDRLLGRIFEALWRRWPEDLPKMEHPPEARTVAERDAIIHDWFDRVLVGDETIPPADVYPAAELPAERRRKGLLYPAIMVSEARRARGEQGVKRIKALLDHAEPACRNGLRLTALGLAARQLDDRDRYERMSDLLASPAWRHEENGLLRVVPERASILYSPLLIAWWRPVGDGPLPDGFLNEAEEIETINWSGFADREKDGRSAGTVVDPKRRLVSHSLLDIWIQLHTAPSKPSHQRILIDDAYDGVIAGLERLWRQLFAVMLHQRGRPLICLSPWPAPFDAALSLRYDVDRPIGAARVRELVDMQSRLANAAFGTWYFRRNDPDEERFSPLLRRYAQIQAKHIETIDEVVPGVGVTHHSAPTSSYWEGDNTILSLHQRQADYGEFHASELPTPRQALLQIESDDALAGVDWDSLFLIPLHFPLEGGTDDRSLDYFDRHIDAFRRRIEQGGHTIIGTHPDLNQELLAHLFARESFTSVWFTSVEAVVRRMRVLAAVKLVSHDDQLCLLSASSLADLMVVYRHADGTETEHVLQLLPGRPRPLPESDIA
jgi:acetyltransferase-like isoleucine patch superfamily enzyme